MSHHTTVTKVYNTTIYIDQLNEMGKSGGMTPIPAGTPVTQAAQQFSQFLQGELTKKWKTQFPSNDPAGSDNGYMEPLTANIPGTAPKCVVDQITNDLDAWELPTSSEAATKIAKMITGELSAQGGVLGFQQGRTQVTSNETILWMVGYGSFDVTQTEQGVVYVFSAALQY